MTDLLERADLSPEYPGEFNASEGRTIILPTEIDARMYSPTVHLIGRAGVGLFVEPGFEGGVLFTRQDAQDRLGDAVRYALQHREIVLKGSDIGGLNYDQVAADDFFVDTDSGLVVPFSATSMAGEALDYYGRVVDPSDMPVQTPKGMQLLTPDDISTQLARIDMNKNGIVAGRSSLVAGQNDGLIPRLCQQTSPVGGVQVGEYRRSA